MRLKSPGIQPLLQRVGDPESVNTMKLEVEPGVELLPSRRISAADLEDRLCLGWQTLAGEIYHGWLR